MYILFGSWCKVYSNLPSQVSFICYIFFNDLLFRMYDNSVFAMNWFFVEQRTCFVLLQTYSDFQIKFRRGFQNQSFKCCEQGLRNFVSPPFLIFFFFFFFPLSCFSLCFPFCRLSYYLPFVSLFLCFISILLYLFLLFFLWYLSFIFISSCLYISHIYFVSLSVPSLSSSFVTRRKYKKKEVHFSSISFLK